MLAHLGPIAQATLGSIGGALDRLQRLAVAIRRASTNDLASRVQSFRQNYSDDDRSFEEAALEAIKKEIPSISESLANQLASSVAFRTLRLRYQQRHHRKLSNRRQVERKPPPTQAQKDAQVVRFQPLAEASKPYVPPPVEFELTHQTESSDVLSTTTYSHLDARKLQQDLSDTQSYSSGPSIKSLSGGKYVYPRQPKAAEGAETCACTWCFEELKVSQLEIGGWWRFVFLSCLMALICDADRFEVAL